MLEPLKNIVDKVLKYSTPFGHAWSGLLFFFRLLPTLTIGQEIFDDEQEEFLCTSGQPACTEQCYNEFSPIRSDLNEKILKNSRYFCEISNFSTIVTIGCGLFKCSWRSFRFSCSHSSPLKSRPSTSSTQHMSPILKKKWQKHLNLQSEHRCFPLSTTGLFTRKRRINFLITRSKR